MLPQGTMSGTPMNTDGIVRKVFDCLFLSFICILSKERGLDYERIKMLWKVTDIYLHGRYATYYLNKSEEKIHPPCNCFSSISQLNNI